jgi:hypothetical protein
MLKNYQINTFIKQINNHTNDMTTPKTSSNKTLSPRTTNQYLQSSLFLNKPLITNLILSQLEPLIRIKSVSNKWSKKNHSNQQTSIHLNHPSEIPKLRANISDIITKISSPNCKCWTTDWKPTWKTKISKICPLENYFSKKFDIFQLF